MTLMRIVHAGRRPVTRALALGLVLAGVGLSMAGCSPPSRNNVAIFLSDGHPTALLHPCEGEAVTELAVTDLTTPSAPRPGTTTPADGIGLYVPYWDVQASDPDARPTEVRLLTVPAGWTLDPDVVFHLAEFHADYRYRLGTTQVGSRDVEFTLADLEALADGQVWARSAQGNEAAMSRDDFFHIAESHCG